MPNKERAIPYRPDIDSLRAIAVLSVVFYHAFPKAFKGGFIGVDVFFVISGYLISYIILTNLNNNSFTIYNFYAKRIKRIFPALILVVSASLCFGWAVLIDKEYLQLGKHAEASSLFYTNFILAKEAGYFDVSSNFKPLMHLWSLAIEEQFYLIWPLLLGFLYARGFNITTSCFLIALLSFMLNIKMAYKAPIKAFYFPHYRFWELASGALLAYISLVPPKIPPLIKAFEPKFRYFLNSVIYRDAGLHRPNILNDLSSILGLIIIFVCVFGLKKNSLSGAIGSLPIIGAVLLIAAGSEAWVNKILLSNRAMVWVGLISYPLYLWHWPFLSFSYILEGDKLDLKIKFILIITSVIVAWVTYRFIERPIRSADNNKALVGALLGMFVATGIAGYFIQKNEGFPNRYGNLVATPPVLPQNYRQVLDLAVDCDSFKRTKLNFFPDPLCLLSSTATPKLAIFGDSHSWAYGVSAVNDKLSIILHSMSGLMVSDQYVNYHPPTHMKEERVKALNMEWEIMNKILSRYKTIEYVLLATRGPLYFTGIGFGIEEDDESLNGWVIERISDNETLDQKNAFADSYVNTIDYLISKGKKVIFAIDIPELGIDPVNSCVRRATNLNSNIVSNCIIKRESVDNRQREYRELVAKIKKRVPSLLVYDPISLLCDQENCYGKKGEIFLYGDDDHLSVEGGKLLTDHFKKWFDQVTSEGK